MATSSDYDINPIICKDIEHAIDAIGSANIVYCSKLSPSGFVVDNYDYLSYNIV